MNRFAESNRGELLSKRIDSSLSALPVDLAPPLEVALILVALNTKSFALEGIR